MRGEKEINKQNKGFSARCSKIDPIDPEKSGNTKQISPAKKWCFTWNNYNTDGIEKLKNLLSKEMYIYGKEIGEEGTPHLQGFVIFNKKIRPLSVCPKELGIHWEKTKGTVDENIAYCSKDGDWTSQGLDPIKLINPTRKWQIDILKLIEGIPHDRTINWFYDLVGGKGKTCLSKYLVVKRNACVVGGKSHDIKYGIMKYKDDNGFYPNIVIFDIARSCNLVSYQAIEEVKNGLFYSGKYEGRQAVFNSPHVIIFSNCEPNYDKLSADRLSVVEIK